MTGVLGGAGHRPWLLRQPSEERPARLFCFPYSGCGASMYRRWPTHAGGVEICPLQVPGRENRIKEPHFGTFEALADALCPDLERFLDRPYALFGHCAGALMAYEVSLRIAATGRPPPARLFVSSQPAPHVSVESGFVAMSDADLRAELARLIVGLGGRPTEEMVELYLSVYQPDLAATRRYRRRAAIPAPTHVTVLSWTDSGVSRDGLAGWNEYGDVTTVDLPGGHYDFLSAPAHLIRLLTDWAPAPNGRTTVPV